MQLQLWFHNICRFLHVIPQTKPSMDIVIRRATEEDYKNIVAIGRIAVEAAHRASCSEADMQHYLATNYNEHVIRDELRDKANIYNILFCDGQPAGFSKIVLNAAHANIVPKNVTKLDRI